MKTKILDVIFVLVGLLIIIHHVITSGRLFDVGDMLHHEFFEAIFFAAGIIILITSHSN